MYWASSAFSHKNITRILLNHAQHKLYTSTLCTTRSVDTIYLYIAGFILCIAIIMQAPTTVSWFTLSGDYTLLS